MAAAAAVQFKTCLTNVCMFSDAAATYIMTTLTSVDVFMQIQYATMDGFIKHISQKHVLPVVVAPALPVVLPFPACQNLKALRAWLDYRYLRGNPLTVPDFTDAMRMVWLRRTVFLDSVRDKKGFRDGVESPGPLKNLTDWQNWELKFSIYLAHHRNI